MIRTAILVDGGYYRKRALSQWGPLSAEARAKQKIDYQDKNTKSCGYPFAVKVDTFEDLDKQLSAAKARNELSLIEVSCSIGARDDLGRPTTTAIENKENFMEYLKTL